MFCPECGTQLENGINSCCKCGRTLKESIVFPAEKANDNPEPHCTEASPEITISTSRAKAKPKPNRLKIIIPVAAIITIVLAVIISVSVYRNSDDYKIQKASELIISGDYFESTNLLNDIYTPQAIAIKNFVNVELAKDNFLSAATTDDLSTVNEAYLEFYYEVLEFDSDNIYYLTEYLQSHYYCYKNAFDYVSIFSNYENSNIPSALYSVQEVMMNRVQMNSSSKDGNTFTVKDLQNRITQARYGLSVLEKTDFTNITVTDANVISHCFTSKYYQNDTEIYCIYLSDYLVEIITTLISECREEIYTSQNKVDETLKEFDIDADLYLTNPTSNYSSYVGNNLDNIKSNDDISNNRNKIVELLRRDILFYLLTGEQFVQKP